MYQAILQCGILDDCSTVIKRDYSESPEVYGALLRAFLISIAIASVSPPPRAINVTSTAVSRNCDARTTAKPVENIV